VFFPATDEVLKNLDHQWFSMHAYRLSLSDGITLVDATFLLAHPVILGENSARMKVLRREYTPVFAGSPANRRGVFRRVRFTGTPADTTMEGEGSVP
jgi:hypothetical protein